MFKLLSRKLLKFLFKDNIKQLIIKNGKINKLRPEEDRSYTVPIINISSYAVNTIPLRYGLNYSFVDKNRYVKRDIAVEFENLISLIDDNINDNNKQLAYDFLRSSSNTFTQNIYRAKDKTFSSLNKLRNNNNIVILSGDKDSSVIIVNKTDYVNKINDMISEGINDNKYVISNDTTLKDLHNFQAFLYRNFKDHKNYKQLRPSSNQPAKLFATAKTHKFDSFNDININDLKLRPIMDQIGTHTYNASKIIAKYLTPLSKNDYVIDNTLTFPSLIRECHKGDDDEVVSYDVKSLFTSIPLNETIEYIIHEIYNNKMIEPFCKKKLIFKNLLIWLTKDCLFSANSSLYKQIDGCPMGGPISVVMSGIFMSKLEKDVLKPPLPIFYKRYVDDIYVRRKLSVEDKLFEDLNNYHNNITFTIEKNPKKFLDTQIIFENNNIITEVVCNNFKLPAHWSSKIPKRYKRNTINGELHRAKQIASNFQNEINKIRTKYKNAGYPLKFINSVISSFNNENRNDQPWDENKPRIIINLPFCTENENYAKVFLSKLNDFTGNKYSFIVTWKTRKIRSLFPLKDQVDFKHCSNIIYEGTCSCGNNYIGVTDRNSILRFDEHDNENKSSEPSKHLKDNENHKFGWKLLSKASRERRRGRILETFFIKIRGPSLNNQTENYKLKLFHNGVT